ncbi:MAG: hypothetical protein [Bacteriophage sp.]|nr:MAG: hypothetical protein [Bacteriophage sp.]
MTTQTVAELLQERVTADALALTNDSLLDEVDMLTEAMAEATDVDEVDYDEEMESYQFHNQDHLNGLSDDDISNLNPDSSTKHHNDTGKGTGKSMHESSLTLIEQLLSKDTPSDNTDPVDFPEEQVFDSTDIDSYTH